MNNNHINISLLCIIILNCFWYLHKTRGQEGFDFEDLNPAKWVEKLLGKLIDAVLGSVPILKDIAKKVKKEKGFFAKIKTTFFELFMSLLTIIFIPVAAVGCLVLAYQIFLSAPVIVSFLLKPNEILRGIINNQSFLPKKLDNTSKQDDPPNNALNPEDIRDLSSRPLPPKGGR